jgi:hypothetical protein
MKAARLAEAEPPRTYDIRLAIHARQEQYEKESNTEDLNG